jgi:hypothetical protein
MGVERVAVVWRNLNDSQQQLRTAAMEAYEGLSVSEFVGNSSLQEFLTRLLSSAAQLPA